MHRKRQTEKPKQKPSKPKEGQFAMLQEPYEEDSRPLAVQFEHEEEDDISLERREVNKSMSRWKPRTFDIEFSCIENYHSASILIYFRETNGLKKFLMGQERRGWSNFGGRRSRGEFDPAITAIREYCEETRYYLDPPKDMRMLWSSKGHVLFYGSFDEEPDLDGLHAAPIDYSTEKTKYAWVYGKDFMHSINNSRSGSSLPVVAHANNETFIIEVIRVLAEEFRDIDPTLII